MRAFIGFSRVAVVVSVASCIVVPEQAKVPEQAEAPKQLDAQAKAAADAAQPKCKAGMVGIPAGTFTMGDDENREMAREVTVAGFCMDRTEVTTAAYEKCVKSGKCTETYMESLCNAGPAGRAGVAERENRPINCVYWKQATAYCEAQGLRLPTEKEWEYAARGTDGRLYPWGNAAPKNQLCWDGEGNDLGKGKRYSTCAVGSYPSGNSPFGLADMAGNVWEWTSDTTRGGSWRDDDPSFVRSAYRYRMSHDQQADNVGFRCAGDPLP